jgi:hypothetical protein
MALMESKITKRTQACRAEDTPDAVFLLDRHAGFFFTGDTYYPGRIWLNATGNGPCQPENGARGAQRSGLSAVSASPAGRCLRLRHRPARSNTRWTISPSLCLLRRLKTCARMRLRWIDSANDDDDARWSKLLDIACYFRRPALLNRQFYACLRLQPAEAGG